MRHVRSLACQHINSLRLRFSSILIYDRLAQSTLATIKSLIKLTEDFILNKIF